MLFLLCLDGNWAPERLGLSMISLVAMIAGPARKEIEDEDDDEGRGRFKIADG